MKRKQERMRRAGVIGAKLVLFVAGLMVLALGAVSLMRAAVGAATWDVLHIGLAGLTGWSIGSWVQIVGIAMIGMACVLDRQWPRIGSVANILLIGYIVNGFLDAGIVPSFSSLWARFALLLAGIVLMGIGSGMYVASGIGAGPRDGLTLSLARLTGRSIRLVRTFLEGIALLCGWLAGGPVSVGTFVSVFLIGPVMQASLGFWRSQVQRWERWGGEQAGPQAIPPVQGQAEHAS